MTPDIKTVAEALAGAPIIKIEADTITLFRLTALIQTALRHPGIEGTFYDDTMHIARIFQSKLAEVSPAIAQTLEPGFNEGMDISKEEARELDTGKFGVESVHNIYTLYELDEDGSQAEREIISFARPQDWGDPERWHYHTCTVQFELPDREGGRTRFVNHCHLWQEVKRSPVEAYQQVSEYLFMVMMPGQPEEECGRSHLREDDFWLEEWGEMPPYTESEGDYFEPGGDYFEPGSVSWYVAEDERPIYWRNETSGRLAAAVEAYFAPYAEPDDGPVPELSPEHLKLIKAYLVKHLLAPCYWKNPAASSAEKEALQIAVNEARAIANRADLRVLIDALLKIGIDPF